MLENGVLWREVVSEVSKKYSAVVMEHMLVARRLVEAGARCVTLAFSRWDHHGDNFGALRQDLPLFDRGVSALVEDLRQRGLRQKAARLRVRLEQFDNALP